MKLPTINLDLLRSIPLVQKVGLLLMVLAGIIVRSPYVTEAGVIRSESGPGGLATLLAFQRVGTASYYSAAGFADRTVGLPAEKAASR